MATIVEDARSVDPIAYIRAVGLRPEDSYGFLPLDVHDRASFFFLYRDRPEYAQAREALPAAGSLTNIDIGITGFQFGQERQVDVDVPAAKPGGQTGDLIAQAMEMQAQYQQTYGNMIPGVTGDPGAARLAQLENLKAMGVLDGEMYEQARYGIEGGHAGAEPGRCAGRRRGRRRASIVAHRLYPRLHKRSLSDQFDDFLPRYRDALSLCPEDVYGVFPRHTLTGSGNSGNVTSWEDYWLVYRDRPEYAQGRSAWAAEMNEPGGFKERLFSSMLKELWPDAEVVPGVAGPSTAAFDGGRVETEKDRWPRE